MASFNPLNDSKTEKFIILNWKCVASLPIFSLFALSLCNSSCLLFFSFVVVIFSTVADRAGGFLAHMCTLLYILAVTLSGAPPGRETPESFRAPGAEQEPYNLPDVIDISCVSAFLKLIGFRISSRAPALSQLISAQKYHRPVLHLKGCFCFDNKDQTCFLFQTMHLFSQLQIVIFLLFFFVLRVGSRVICLFSQTIIHTTPPIYSKS